MRSMVFSFWHRFRFLQLVLIINVEIFEQNGTGSELRSCESSVVQASALLPEEIAYCIISSVCKFDRRLKQKFVWGCFFPLRQAYVIKVQNISQLWQCSSAPDNALEWTNILSFHCTVFVIVMNLYPK